MVRKRILTLCLSVVMVVSLASVCFAASFDFTSSSDMKFVDSNAWTYVCAEKKDSAGKTASLSVTKFITAIVSRVCTRRCMQRLRLAAQAFRHLRDP